MTVRQVFYRLSRGRDREDRERVQDGRRLARRVAPGRRDSLRLDRRQHPLEAQADHVLDVEEALGNRGGLPPGAVGDQVYVEVWLEKDALAGVLMEVTGVGRAADGHPRLPPSISYLTRPPRRSTARQAGQARPSTTSATTTLRAGTSTAQSSRGSASRSSRWRLPQPAPPFSPRPRWPRFASFHFRRNPFGDPRRRRGNKYEGGVREIRQPRAGRRHSAAPRHLEPPDATDQVKRRPLRGEPSGRFRRAGRDPAGQAPPARRAGHRAAPSIAVSSRSCR